MRTIHIPEGWRFKSLPQSESTNEEIKSLPKEEADKIAIQADIQTAGKGRMGRHWVSPKGNLYISLGLKLQSLTRAGEYSFLTAVVLAETLKELCPEMEPQCKWPNDVLVNGKKISGILLETDGKNRLIIGMGLNLISMPTESVLYPVTSIANEGYEVTVEQAAEVFLKVFAVWQEKLKTDGFQAVLSEWERHAYGIGGPITVNLPDRKIEGIFTGLDKDGCLLLDCNKEIIKITAGDVFFGAEGKK